MELTERQRAFAEENHHLVEEFLKYRNLPIDEYYDVVIFRYLRAVQQYDERDDLKQYKFSTIAKNHMRSALGNHFKKEKSRNSKVKMLSLDYPFFEGNGTLHDIVADERVDVCGTVCNKLSRTSKQPRLTNRAYKRTVMYAAVKEAA